MPPVSLAAAARVLEYYSQYPQFLDDDESQVVGVKVVSTWQPPTPPVVEPPSPIQKPEDDVPMIAGIAAMCGVLFILLLVMIAIAVWQTRKQPKPARAFERPAALVPIPESVKMAAADDSHFSNGHSEDSKEASERGFTSAPAEDPNISGDSEDVDDKSRITISDWDEAFVPGGQ